jgi:hypothetical protein
VITFLSYTCIVALQRAMQRVQAVSCPAQGPQIVIDQFVVLTNALAPN